MRSTRPLTRWLALLLALVLFAAACGDDSSDDAVPGDDAADASADDASDGTAEDSGEDGMADDGSTADGGDDGADDSTADDSAADDSTADDSGADDGTADGSADGVPGLGDCAEFAAAMEGLDDLSDAAGNATGNDPAAVQADFQQALASITALQNALPDDLKGDAEVIRDGIAAMDAAFATIGYDVTALTDPADALAFAGVMSGPEVIAMANASINIQQWVTAGC